MFFIDKSDLSQLNTIVLLSAKIRVFINFFEEIKESLINYMIARNLFSSNNTSHLQQFEPFLRVRVLN